MNQRQWSTTLGLVFISTLRWRSFEIAFAKDAIRGFKWATLWLGERIA